MVVLVIYDGVLYILRYYQLAVAVEWLRWLLIDHSDGSGGFVVKVYGSYSGEEVVAGDGCYGGCYGCYGRLNHSTLATIP